MSSSFVDVDTVPEDEERDATFLSWLTNAPPAASFDTEEIRFIKASGLIPDGVLKMDATSCSVYDDDGKLLHAGYLQDPGREYRQLYVKYRNRAYYAQLADKTRIIFADEAAESESDEGNPGSKSKPGVYLDAFNSGKFRLTNADEVLIPASEMNVHFCSPNWKDHVTFRLVALDEMLGFTRKELGIRIMTRYRMLYWLCFNYNLKSGLPDNANPSHLFAPVLRESEWSHNGIAGLKYDKKHDRWEVECIEYV